MYSINNLKNVKESRSHFMIAAIASLTTVWVILFMGITRNNISRDWLLLSLCMSAMTCVLTFFSIEIPLDEKDEEKVSRFKSEKDNDSWRSSLIDSWATRAGALAIFQSLIFLQVNKVLAIQEPARSTLNIGIIIWAFVAMSPLLKIMDKASKSGGIKNIIWLIFICPTLLIITVFIAWPTKSGIIYEVQNPLYIVPFLSILPALFIFFSIRQNMNRKIAIYKSGGKKVIIEIVLLISLAGFAWVVSFIANYNSSYNIRMVISLISSSMVFCFSVVIVDALRRRGLKNQNDNSDLQPSVDPHPSPGPAA